MFLIAGSQYYARNRAASVPTNPENVMLHSSSLTSLSPVFSSTFSREMLTNPSPLSIAESLHNKNQLKRVPGDLVFTDLTELKACPPLILIRQERKFSDETGKPIDFD